MALFVPRTCLNQVQSNQPFLQTGLLVFNAVIVGAYQVIANKHFQSVIEVGNSTLCCAVAGKYEGFCCGFVVLPHWEGKWYYAL
ncbi:hypothetical protein D8T25_22230 [Vibrio vulnificus]|nr:hypothetical protein DOT35_10185 [Vibrio vulnificus]RZQ94782.1 hypothetical protein D8T25_22230 [Vibrio vulnificus]HAS8241639.1 hypothetical protein [Vibrio vulnificus]HAS8282412.1 hypothetical protein [Vibrio vulnificus]HAS8371807.1 hypothetical protein [Vibrio vulnificus]